MSSFALQIVLAILLVGDALFLAQAIASPWLAAILILLLAVGVAAALPPGRKPTAAEARAVAAACGLALVLSLLGGQGHLVFASEDWPVRDAVLADLVRSPWPVTYSTGTGLAALRAPVGFYMAPAEVGRVFGLGAAHAALVIQDTLLLGAILWLLSADAPRARDKAVVLGVLLAFGGFDVLGEALRVAMVRGGGEPLPFPLHMERWSGIEYASVITGLFWAPNHTLPALAFLGAYLSWRRGEIGSPGLAVTAGAALVWSPFAVMGALPFLALAAVQDLRAGRLSVRTAGGAVVAGAALLPAAVYLTLASGGVPHGWTLLEAKFRLFAPLFYALEVAPILMMLLVGGTAETRASRAELVLAAGLILVLPLYRIGVSNDFVARASVPVLGFAALVAADRLAWRLDRGATRAAAPMLAVLAVSAVTPAFELARVFVHPATPPSGESLPQAWARSDYAKASLAGYVAPASAFAPWRGLLRAPAAP